MVTTASYVQPIYGVFVRQAGAWDQAFLHAAAEGAAFASVFFACPGGSGTEVGELVEVGVAGPVDGSIVDGGVGEGFLGFAVVVTDGVPAVVVEAVVPVDPVVDGAGPEGAALVRVPESSVPPGAGRRESPLAIAA